MTAEDGALPGTPVLAAGVAPRVASVPRRVSAVVAHELLDEPTNRALDEERFLRQCMIVGEQWALQHRIGGMESASLEMFRNALQLAQHRGLVRSAAGMRPTIPS